MHAFSGSSQHSVEESKAVPEHPGLARELSSSTVSASMESLDLSMAPSVPNVTIPTHADTLPTDPAAPQTVAPPKFPQAQQEKEETEMYAKLKAARNSGQPEAVAEAVAQFRTMTVDPTIAEYNMALDALRSTRRVGEPLHLLLEVYNEMLRRGLSPNARTYGVLLEALTGRDYEVTKSLANVSLEARRQPPYGSRLAAGLTHSEEIINARVKQYKSENNFASAMTLFEALVGLVGNRAIPVNIYLVLLRSCSQHANVKAALHVWNQLSKRPDVQIPPLAYLYLITVFAKTKDIARATATFDEFRKACAEGSLPWTTAPQKNPKLLAYQTRNSQTIQVQVYNKMIETHFMCGEHSSALALLEEMMDSPADPKSFTLADIPPPASSTYTQIITGFCQANDIPSALTWFEKLLAQPAPPAGQNINMYQSAREPGRPDRFAWRVLLDKLASEGMVADLNRLFVIGLDTSASSVTLGAEEGVIVFNANTAFCSQTTDSKQALECLDLMRHLMKQNLVQPGTHEMVIGLVELFVKHGAVEQAVELVEWQSELQKVNVAPSKYQGPGKEFAHSQVQQTLSYLSATVVSGFGAALPWTMVHRLLNVLQEWSVQLPSEVGAQVLGSYHLALKSGDFGNESNLDWELLVGTAPAFTNAVGIESASQVFVDLLSHMASSGVKLSELSPVIVQQLLTILVGHLGEEGMKDVLCPIAPSIAEAVDAFYPQASSPAMDDAASQTAASESELSQGTQDTLVDTPVIIDPHHSRHVDEWFHTKSSSDDRNRLTAHDGYARYIKGLEQHRYPVPTTFAHLITGFGRLGDVEKVTSLYSDAQRVIGSLEKNKEWQTQSWFTIEDSMIVGLAHAGDLNAAHLHRVRVLEQGGAPSADAYGALIQYVKDTTDDTSSAMALFQESQSRGVRPNIYLYNNIISKLAKARKADYALELFQQMKANQVPTSSITYGALIAACARVGDHHSAEQLFTEMVTQRNFKPRVPPYNTMMQLYTTTKPSRERSLFYYDAMRTAGVRPTAHTYKVCSSFLSLGDIDYLSPL